MANEETFPVIVGHTFIGRAKDTAQAIAVLKWKLGGGWIVSKQRRLISRRPMPVFVGLPKSTLDMLAEDVLPAVKGGPKAMTAAIRKLKGEKP